ncbi:S-adenosyl-L-methionine-dependent methyltransferase [Pleomassaria siparia CBS 279.74]|uniref:S-adenosyl-L-methionine-dependent methyltransferase n=1 Tax=Pleomassaria siparia CBS 279.74 TaxID=1314801 RepID=A0A6G1K9J4_9PLEO|nr:S-adenosyl-L-methionine-dependent methyltransferase [Pleomassaria siparia CBS 279.74]
MSNQEPYWLGRASEELQRLHRQHYIWTKNIGYLVHPTIASTLPEKARIADIGCGTGIWLSEVAKVSPSTYRFDGYDISDASFQPADSLPPNVTLGHGDFKKPFPEELHGQFDLINIRLIVISMGEGVWESTLRNMLALLKPGGAIQWTEGDFLVARGFRGANSTSSGGHYLTQGQLKLNSTLVKRFGYNFPDFNKLFTDAGLQNVGEDVSSTDRFVDQRHEFTEIGIGAVFGALRNVASAKQEGYWTEEEVEQFRLKAVDDMQSGAYLRWDLHVTFGFTSK